MPSGSPPPPKPGSKVLVMTGGTSGFGRRALERVLCECPEWSVVLIARRSSRLAEIIARAAPTGRLLAIEADLASLQSVSDATDEVIRQLDGRRIDAVALNAGIQALNGDQASADGLELSFAVNHLAHFLMLEQLSPHLADGGRVVMTSSEVHDPSAFCLVGITRATWEPVRVMADAAHSQNHFSERVDRGEARYCASKLLNLMTVRHWGRTERRFATLAFNPSVVPGTDIARDRNALQILLWKRLMTLLAPVLPGARTLDRSAADLLWLITDANAAAMTGCYVNGRTVEAGSPESNDPSKIAEVIEVSRQLLTEKLEISPSNVIPLYPREPMTASRR